MTTAAYTEKDLNIPRILFLIFCGCFIIGDVLGVLSDTESFLFFIGIGVFGIFSWKLSRYICLSALLGIGIGFLIWQQAFMLQYERYSILVNMTKNFSTKWTITWHIDTLLFKKERSSVYRLYIDNFDTLDNFDKNYDNALNSSYLREKTRTSLFIEVPSNLRLNRGDHLEIPGKIMKNIDFPLKGFSRYAFYQWGFGSLYAPSFEVLKRWESSVIDTARSYWIDTFRRYFSNDIAGTLLGMTIGSVDLLSGDIKKAFIGSGVSHILVVSGANIAFLILIVTFFLKYLPLGKYVRGGIVWVFLLFYGTLVWWEISVVRATLMGILSYIIVEYGGRWSSKSALGLAWLILVCIHPLAPLYDAGFGLSFGATLGILLFHQPIEKWCKRYRFPRGAISVISVSIGAMLGSLPMLVFHFEKIPLSTLLTNLLIGGFLWWILFCAVFFVLIESISFFLAVVFWITLFIPTKIILILSEFFQYGWTITLSPLVTTPLTLFFLGIFFYFFLEEEFRTRTLYAK
jgi:ComEC/Rec2-related protein